MTSPASGRLRGLVWFALPLAVLVGLLIYRLQQHYPTRVFDIYPVYFGAKAWWHTGNAYALHAVSHVSSGQQLARVGNVYPLPASLLFLPIAALPPTAASCVFITLAVASLTLASRVSGYPPLLLFYLPVFEGLRIEQLTIPILAAEILAIWAFRGGRHRLLAVLLAICLLKPNQTVVLVAYLLWCDRRHWRTHLAVIGGVYALSLAFQPDWPRLWFHTALARGGALASRPQLMWWLALGAIPLWRWGDRIGALVFVQFLLLSYPPNGIYVMAILALGALDLRRMPVLVASVATWIVTTPLGAVPAAALGLALPRLLIGYPPIRRRLPVIEPRGDQSAASTVTVTSARPV